MSKRDMRDVPPELLEMIRGMAKCSHEVQLESVMGILASHVLAQGGRLEVDTSPALNHEDSSGLKGLGVMIVPKEGHPNVVIVELRPTAEIVAANEAMEREELAEEDGIDASRYVHPTPGGLQ